MPKIWDWILSRKRKSLDKYEEIKKEFEEVIGRPSITITVELPKNLENLKKEFLSLETDEKFHNAIKNLVQDYLKKKKRGMSK